MEEILVLKGFYEQAKAYVLRYYVHKTSCSIKVV